MYALFDQLFPRQQELHADLEVAILDRVTESVDFGPYGLRVGQKVCDLRPNLRGPQASPRENRIRASHTRLKNGSRKLGHVDFDVVRDSAEDHVVGRHGPEDRTRHELGMKPRCRPRSTTAACAPRAAQEGCGAAAACRAASS
jgi:hypothetical protein